LPKTLTIENFANNFELNPLRILRTERWYHNAKYWTINPSFAKNHKYEDEWTTKRVWEISRRKKVKANISKWNVPSSPFL